MDLLLAEVGATGTQEDATRRVVAITKVLEAASAFFSKPIYEAVTLPRRDFLTDTGRYDVVILHSIFHTRHPFIGLPDSGWAPSEVYQSPRHSVEAWRNRLIATGARFIVVCGGPLTLDGWNPGDVPGYAILERGESPPVTVYKRMGVMGIPAHLL